MNWLFGKKSTEDRREPWQIAIDKEEERKKKEEGAKKLLDERKRQEEYQRNVQKLGETFKCHCCGKPSTKPGQRSYLSSWDTTNWEVDWSYPGDLHPCEHCGQLTCTSCLYKGICKTCALKIVSKH